MGRLCSRTKKKSSQRRSAPRLLRISKRGLPTVVPAGGEQPLNETLPQAVRRIVHSLHPEKIILFGSYAYGQPNSDSDVDLLVVWQSRASPKDRYLAVCRLLRPRPFAVDLLVKTPQEVATALRQGDLFMQEIMTRGQVLYKRTRSA